ncbi:hypothetical protein HanIR_Chr11g0511671 [Helianthus annuus]|nr:hypothetical protein HanIR_Chr11g0511671 [Helianthus annuus]
MRWLLMWHSQLITTSPRPPPHRRHQPLPPLATTLPLPPHYQPPPSPPTSTSPEKRLTNP